MTPPSTDQLLLAGAAHQRAGRLEEAAALYQQVLAVDPRNVAALDCCAALALRVNRPDHAARLLARAVEVRPDAVPLRYKFAAALRALGRLDQALEQSRAAAALQPGSADALCDVGSTLAAMGRESEAMAEFQKALALDPGHAAANYNFGVSLQKQRRFAEAAEALRWAIDRAPFFPVAHNNLGSVLRELDRPDEAIAHYRTAIEQKPDDPRYRSNLALALQDLGQIDEAVASFDDALRIRPDYFKAVAFRAMAVLLKGDYARGFAGYEARREVDGSFPDRSAGRPLWDGSDVAGKTVLLHAEQGLGDTIQFVRYTPLLAARGARVIVQCQPPLKTLLEASLLPRGVWQVAADGEAVPDFDLHCPLPGLPHRFGTRIDTIPADVPYLQAPPDRVGAWRQHVEADDASPGTVFRVGIVWAGARGNRNDHRRSVPLALFGPLARVPGVRLYSLQKGETTAADLAGKPDGMAVEDWGSDFADFADTAGALMNLDLVICVDTSVAHLAGALGRPVWTLVPFSPDWRWMLGRSDSPWYPTMRLFRQPKPGDWAGAVEALGEALRSESTEASHDNTNAKKPRMPR